MTPSISIKKGGRRGARSGELCPRLAGRRREDIQARIEVYDSRVPEELKDGKTVAVTGLVLSLVAGLGLVGAGLFRDDDFY